MKEVWKPIRGFKMYEISNKGRVRSVDRLANSQWGKNTRPIKGKVHTPKIAKGLPYKSVGIRKKPRGKKVYLRINRLVASHFIRPLRKGEIVNHLDFNPSNDIVTNLEITTPKGNMQHSAKAGRLLHGTRHHSCKLTESNVRMLRMLASKGFSPKKLAPEYGITDTSAYKIVHHKSWKHVA